MADPFFSKAAGVWIDLDATRSSPGEAFPRFPSHAVASCFSCGGDFGDGWPMHSGNAAGRGQYMQHCERCRMTTWYDTGEKL